eukprot:3211071-Rhodomonas_salina.1
MNLPCLSSFNLRPFHPKTTDLQQPLHHNVISFLGRCQERRLAIALYHIVLSRQCRRHRGCGCAVAVVLVCCGCVVVVVVLIVLMVMVMVVVVVVVVVVLSLWLSLCGCGCGSDCRHSVPGRQCPLSSLWFRCRSALRCSEPSL